MEYENLSEKLLAEKIVDIELDIDELLEKVNRIIANCDIVLNS